MSEVSKPKSNTLSREELEDEIMLAMNSAVAKAHQQYPYRKKRIEQARQQIKAMLQPVPEEKSRKFVEKWSNEIDSHVYKGWIFDIDLIKQMLKEYDELKEGE